MSPALAGGFLTTAPPGKPLWVFVVVVVVITIPLVTSETKKESPQKSKKQEINTIFCNCKIILFCNFSQGTNILGRAKRKNKIRGEY